MVSTTILEVIYTYCALTLIRINQCRGSTLQEGFTQVSL